MKHIRMVVKGIVMVTVLTCYVLQGMIGYYLIRDLHESRKYLFKNLRRYCTLICKILGIKVEMVGYEEFNRESHLENFLVVSNHHSYTDILILASIFQCFFVTSMEMKETPFLGVMCTMGGSLFVERRSRSNISKEINNIVVALKQGWNVGFFPEATSSNGDMILPFKKSLYDSAIEAQKRVLPIVLVYTKVDGKPVSRENRDSVFYYGDLNFVTQFLNLLKLKSIEVRVHFLKPLSIQPDRRALAEESYQQINSIYQSESPLANFPAS